MSMYNTFLYPCSSLKLCNILNCFYSEAVAQRSSAKKVLLEISQNSWENTCARVSFLINLQVWWLLLVAAGCWCFWGPASGGLLLVAFFTHLAHLWWLLLCITSKHSPITHQVFYSENEQKRRSTQVGLNLSHAEV